MSIEERDGCFGAVDAQDNLMIDFCDSEIHCRKPEKVGDNFSYSVWIYSDTTYNLPSYSWFEELEKSIEEELAGTYLLTAEETK